jgi:hypothetical protein
MDKIDLAGRVQDLECEWDAAIQKMHAAESEARALKTNNDELREGLVKAGRQMALMEDHWQGVCSDARRTADWLQGQNDALHRQLDHIRELVWADAPDDMIVGSLLNLLDRPKGSCGADDGATVCVLPLGHAPGHKSRDGRAWL